MERMERAVPELMTPFRVSIDPVYLDPFASPSDDNTTPAGISGMTRTGTTASSDSQDYIAKMHAKQRDLIAQLEQERKRLEATQGEIEVAMTITRDETDQTLAHLGQLLEGIRDKLKVKREADEEAAKLDLDTGQHMRRVCLGLCVMLLVLGLGLGLAYYALGYTVEEKKDR